MGRVTGIEPERQDRYGIYYHFDYVGEPRNYKRLNTKQIERTWEQWVGNIINIHVSEHLVTTPGNHVLKFWAVDPGVVLQKLVIETGTVGKSCLGPPESVYINMD